MWLEKDTCTCPRSYHARTEVTIFFYLSPESKLPNPNHSGHIHNLNLSIISLLLHDLTWYLSNPYFSVFVFFLRILLLFISSRCQSLNLYLLVSMEEPQV
ncbi:hypothetical protein RJT34_23575 [Clitoria ternatea]|uniref:Uncharacterized protein n=1 Tax=Clitoria ternatea TaxID=43366 RepID=A0AAN9IIJ8_CLITE